MKEARKLSLSNKACLNFGCGSNILDGFTNIDGGDGEYFSAPSLPSVVRLDVFKALQCIQDNTSNIVTSEHFFEHFSRQDGHLLLREWFRVLKPCSILRIVIPDLEREENYILDRTLIVTGIMI